MLGRIPAGSRGRRRESSLGLCAAGWAGGSRRRSMRWCGMPARARRGCSRLVGAGCVVARFGPSGLGRWPKLLLSLLAGAGGARRAVAAVQGWREPGRGVGLVAHAASALSAWRLVGRGSVLHVRSLARVGGGGVGSGGGPGLRSPLLGVVGGGVSHSVLLLGQAGRRGRDRVLCHAGRDSALCGCSGGRGAYRARWAGALAAAASDRSWISCGGCGWCGGRSRRGGLRTLPWPGASGGFVFWGRGCCMLCCGWDRS